MAKPIISNTILAIVAGGVLFFIGQSVYDVFTRAPVKGIEANQPKGNSSQPGQTVSGTIQMPVQTLPEQTENANTPSVESGNLPASHVPQHEAQSPATTAKPDTIATEPKAENEAITEENEPKSHALKTNPDLRQVIPPVPLAPPNPFPTPVAPASGEQLFQATDNLDQGASATQKNVSNSFPVPQPSFPAPQESPASIPASPSFETGKGSPFSNFPAPIDNRDANSGNNMPNAELEQLRNLRQQKDQLRNDLGF